MHLSVTPAARQRHRDQLARLLRQRPAQRELVERNIIFLKSEQERREDRERIGIKLNRRLSLRPTADELEQKNILHRTLLALALLLLKRFTSLIIHSICTVVVG